jgi:hypothetical protein
MNKRIAMLVVIVVLVSAIVAGCASTPAPVTLSQLPVYSGATRATSAAVEIGNQMANGVSKLSVNGASVKSVEHQEFLLPADAKADQVIGFFNTELAKDQWTSDPQLAGSDGPWTYKVWTRGSQAACVYHVVNNASGIFGSNVLVVVMLVTLAK